MNEDRQNDDFRHMTRRQYREQHDQPEHDYQDGVNDETKPDESFADRREAVENDQNIATEDKIDRLKHKLNKVIIVLIIAIILVYLILFFVG